ncbi:MAG TPA: ABC transporter ATP-binding protein [Desulfobacterales bacterium]|nr:ABC transporter ATP-binding protein [Desulfobacterales bacterium]
MAPTENPSFILETRNLIKHFGGLTVANGINFSMPVGELRCLIGPNGAGKTTFFNLLTGVIRPSKGNIFFRGKNITNIPSHKIARLGIARAYQVPNIYEGQTVFENIRIAFQQKYEIFNPFASSRRLDGINDKVEEILNRFSLYSKRDIHAAKLAHGEKKRLELGITLACEPKLLLLDEPSAGLTTAETEEIIPVINDISSQKVSILVIEHDMKLVKQIAFSITVLHHGDILFEGSPEEIEANEDVRKVYLGGDQDWY